jgi:hypothetical protein
MTTPSPFRTCWSLSRVGEGVGRQRLRRAPRPRGQDVRLPVVEVRRVVVRCLVAGSRLDRHVRRRPVARVVTHAAGRQRVAREVPEVEVDVADAGVHHGATHGHRGIADVDGAGTSAGDGDHHAVVGAVEPPVRIRDVDGVLHVVEVLRHKRRRGSLAGCRTGRDHRDGEQQRCAQHQGRYSSELSLRHLTPSLLTSVGQCHVPRRRPRVLDRRSHARGRLGVRLTVSVLDVFPSTVCVT